MDKFSTEFNGRKFNNILLDLRAYAKEFGLTKGEEDIQKFVEKAKEWGIPSKKVEIVATVVNANKGRVYMVTRDENDRFRVNRMFAIGGDWVISVDIADCTLDQTFEKLLEND